MYSHIHISGLTERDIISCIKAIPSLRSRLLTDSASSPQLFLHQGPILWKTIFHCLRVGGGLGMIQGHYVYCALYLYYHYISSISNDQALDPGGWGPLSRVTFSVGVAMDDITIQSLFDPHKRPGYFCEEKIPLIQFI